MSNNTDRLSLADAIAGLRAEIRLAQDRARELAPQDKFRITEVELELTVAAEDTMEGSGEAGWWVFKAGVKASGKDAVTHKVRLTLAIGDVLVSSSHSTD